MSFRLSRPSRWPRIRDDARDSPKKDVVYNNAAALLVVAGISGFVGKNTD